jgi:hypothetical protein
VSTVMPAVRLSESADELSRVLGEHAAVHRWAPHSVRAKHGRPTCV